MIPQKHCSIAQEEGSRNLNIIIVDEGKAFNPLAKEDPDITLDEKDRKTGGLVKFIVKNVMDDVTYQREDNKNILPQKRKV